MNDNFLKIKIRRIHIVGIGGAGMSSIATVLHYQGFEITGSDLVESENTRRLEKIGAKVGIGHKAGNVEGADIVVHSTAVKSNNPELIAARENSIPVIRRAEMLAELMRMKDGIAISGTHGKTTTSSMVAWIMIEAGLDPTCLIGGRLESFDSNVHLGKSRYMVAEADESDGSFLRLTPILSIITNIDPEHLDYYSTFDRLLDAFIMFGDSVPFYGKSIVCIDSPTVRNILPSLSHRYVTYGFSRDADFRAREARYEGLNSRFSVWFKGEKLGDIEISMPGAHNVQNALGALACAVEFGVPFETISAALKSFKGVDRRFQVKGEAAGIVVVDDYAHHPEEIRATLKAAEKAADKRVVVLFQPHRYTRVRDLYKEFISSFDLADEVYVCDIYPAGEKQIPGITAEYLYDGIRQCGHPGVHYYGDMWEAARACAETLKPGDMFITLGAGDIKKAGMQVLELLKNPGLGEEVDE